jgi:hypothetical protein
VLHELPPLFQVKATPEGVIEGIASSYGAVDSYNDTVALGAYRETLEQHRQAGTVPGMLWSHKTSEPVGRWTSMAETPRGLAVRGQLNLKTSRGAEAFEHLRGGDLSGLSIGYSIPRGGEEMRSDGVRVLKQIALHEISLVVLGSDAGARISSVKAQAFDPDDTPTTLRELERALHQMGFSKSRSARLAKSGWFEDEPHDVDQSELHSIGAQLHAFYKAINGG